jgi:polyisoprenoid-binding protein YceI
MVRRLALASLVALLSCGLVPPSAFAAGTKFDFKDPKGVNAVAITMDSLLEPVTGLASGVSGELTFDPANPKGATGKITVDVASLQFVNSRYTQAALGSRALDAQTYPRMEFTLKQVKQIKTTSPTLYSGTVLGDFTCHGVTKTITIPVRATYLAGKAKDRFPRVPGDLLILRTDFKIKRSDYGIAQGLGPELVADEVEIRANLVGTAPQSSATVGSR